MESVLRGAATYFFVWILFRLAGKRSLAQITTFDAVLLLIISETTQAALLDNDNSLTNSFLLVLTLLGLDVLLSHLKHYFPALGKVMDGVPLIIYARGVADEMRLDKERLDTDDIRSAARHQAGVGSLDEIEYAVLEQSGGITVIPRRAENGQQ